MYFLDKKIEKIIRDLDSLIYSHRKNIDSYFMRPGKYVNEPAPDLNDGEWTTFSYDDRWSGKNKHYWFVTDVTLPAAFEGKTVYYEARTGREGQWDALNPQMQAYVNGSIVQALDTNHTRFMLTDNAKTGQKYQIAIYAYAGMVTGDFEFRTWICTLEKEVEKLYYHLKIPFESYNLLDQNDKRRADILNYLDNAVNMIDFRKPGSTDFKNSVVKAINYLDEEFYGKYCGHNDVIANCIGHTHIDVAWQWTYEQSREKAVRSFSTVLKLMDEYPDYYFMSSQVPLYKYVKEDKPEVYEKIKERIKEGRWEPEGAMYVEADCNVTSGESLVRQILYGKKFFMDEFGRDSRILWLPDVFGYSAALPQILRKSGVDFFVTSKISWNETNKLPYDTFLWRGIDGSEVLTHFITTQNPLHEGKTHTTYVGKINSQQIRSAWNRYQHKDMNNGVLVTFGYGDGGGGPTKDMLEQALRLEKGIPGMPKVKITNPLDFLTKLESIVINNKRLPEWVGELYLELHRGTYTTMARNKKNNRRSEFSLLDAELFASIAKYLCNDAFPKDVLDNCWELTLLNQFHDVLPGSSIKAVYNDSDNHYKVILSDAAAIVGKALDSITGNIGLKERSVVVFNQLSHSRSGVIEVEAGAINGEINGSGGGLWIEDRDGKLLPVQRTERDGKHFIVFNAANVPSKGYKAFRLVEGSGNTTATVAAADAGFYTGGDGLSMGNKFFDIKFDDCFNIASIFDRQNFREVLKGKANVFQVFEDRPYTFDAWDISSYYQDKMWEVNDISGVEVVEQGPVRLIIRVKKAFLDSIIVQDIVLYNDIPRIDFKTTVDWKEKHLLLKVAFPVDVHTDKATYEIQYGNLERPAHRNTSWDAAKFEVCGHKWADVSETWYGVSLLNDCKYGHDIKDSVMRLTLLRSPDWPNEDADREVHEFTYSLYPHAGDWKQARTQQMAYELNCPMHVRVAAGPNSGGALPAEFSLVSADKDNVVIEVVKQAENGDGSFIIRLFEYKNMRCSTEITFFKNITSVHECDLLENELKELEFNGRSFVARVKPYEIKTFKVKL